jgi:hypothetical protein
VNNFVNERLPADFHDHVSGIGGIVRKFDRGLAVLFGYLHVDMLVLLVLHKAGVAGATPQRGPERVDDCSVLVFARRYRDNRVSLKNASRPRPKIFAVRDFFITDFTDHFNHRNDDLYRDPTVLQFFNGFKRRVLQLVADRLSREGFLFEAHRNVWGDVRPDVIGVRPQSVLDLLR